MGLILVTFKGSKYNLSKLKIYVRSGMKGFCLSIRNASGLDLCFAAFCIHIFMALLIGASTVYGASVQPSNHQILEWMKALKPLPKVHYSWPLQLGLMADDPLLYEYARLTHAISFRGETVKQSHINTAVKVCNTVNRLRPSILCTLAINYSPWHRKFGKDLPPTDFGMSYKAEIEYFKNRLLFIKNALEKENSRYKSEVRISAILLDSERFHIGRKSAGWNASISRRHGLIIDVDEWNASITRKHRVIYDIAKSVFPLAKVVQYERGGWMPSSSSSGWMQAQWYTLEEPGDTYSVSLYRVVELADTREAFRRTVKSASEHAVQEVIPFVALGAGLRRQVDQFHKWSAWDYDLVYSWQIGAELNLKWYGDRPVRFAPWHAAKVVVFFPAPFYKKYTSWPKHFVAYVRGANRVRVLPE